MMAFRVEVKAIGGWTTHSKHDSYLGAVDQADLVHGRVVADGMDLDAALAELPTLTTHDDTGRHFTEWSEHYQTLEAMGLIEIHRPKHEATGIDYDCQYWSVEATDEGLAICNE